MRRKTSTSPTWKETRSSRASHAERPTANASRRVSVRKKFLSERITVLTAMRLSSCSTGISYSCSKRRKRTEPASLSRQSASIPEWTVARTSASCSSGEGRASCVFRKVSIVSWTTLPAQSGRAESFLSRRISSSSSEA